MVLIVLLLSNAHLVLLPSFPVVNVRLVLLPSFPVVNVHFVLLPSFPLTGKSTVLRSLAAVCLLGVSGLLVPAAAVNMSWMDAIILRNFSGDSPAEGRSAFGTEMYEMR